MTNTIQRDALACFARNEETPDDIFQTLQSRMRQMLGTAVKHLNENQLLFITSNIELPAGLIAGLKEWQTSRVAIQSSDFELLACPLKVCLSDAFGEPNIRPEDRTYFESQMKDAGFAVVAPCGGSTVDPVAIFVRLRAVEEMDERIASSNKQSAL